MEIELKLALPARLLARAARHPAVERAAIQSPGTARLLSVYYDTPGLDLRKARVALRLRRTPSGWVQTVKWAGSAIGGLHRRGEIEVPVSGQALDMAALVHPELAPVFETIGSMQRLRPVFATEFERASRLLRIGASRVVFCADRGEIVAGRRREPISELELELIDGDAAVLFDLAAEMQSQLPLRPLNLNKAERGYTLAGCSATVHKARAAALSADLTIGRSAASILAAGLAQLQGNEAGVLLGDDPEYLHQMRVAVRRLRSALGAYAVVLAGERIDALRAELRWLGARLGGARDWDVLRTELLPPLRREFPGDRDLGAFSETAERCRARCNRAARTAVLSRRYARLTLLLGRTAVTADWGVPAARCAEPVLPFAAKLLARRQEKALACGAKLAGRGLAELHALRIAIKKLRYACEFFGVLFPDSQAQTFRGRVVTLQARLGAINDQAMLRRLVRAALPRRALRLGALVAGWSAHAVHTERARLRKAWRGFRRAPTFW